MPEIKLKSVNVKDTVSNSDYIVSMVADCSYGYEGVKLIKSASELERYYYGLKYRSGIKELLNSGANLLIKRLNRSGTSNSTLRLLDHNKLKYTYPKDYRSIDPIGEVELVDLDPYNDVLSTRGLGDSIQYNRSHTYNYVIDFNDSDMMNRDYLAIPKYNNSNLDNSVLFYFTDFEPTNGSSMESPDEFDPPVTLDSVGIDTIAINSQDPFLKNRRAKIIYDWYLGNLFTDPRYFIVNGYGDPNVIPSLCEYNEEDNKVTLVFRKPVSNIKYSNSLGNTKFEVSSDEYIDYDLLTNASLSNSVVSFESVLVGKSQLKLKLTHLKGYIFILDINYRDSESSFEVSLDRDDIGFDGESLFIEDVLSKEYDLLKCHVNLGNRIESTGNDHYPISEAKNLSGTYYVSKGKLGDESPVYNYDLNYMNYPFYKSVDEIIESDVTSNLFMFNEFTDLNYQKYANDLLIRKNNMIGLVSVPDKVITNFPQIDELESYLLPKSDRSNLIYVLGDSDVGLEFIPNTYYYALIGVTNRFNKTIQDNKFISELSINDKEILDYYKINYLENDIDKYYINFIHNYSEFLDPSYLYVSNYIYCYIERLLKSNLSMYSKTLGRKLSTEISVLSNYSNLIKNLKIGNFEVNKNEVNITIDLSLEGLTRRIIEMRITINK